MKTYAQRITELHQEYTAQPFITTYSDIRKIEKALGLCEMETELELRNMRDMVVMMTDVLMNRADFEGDSHEAYRLMNNMQSITSVIDNQLSARGFRV